MVMTIDEAITRYKNNAVYERAHGNLQGCLEFRQLADWLTLLKQITESGNCNTCACKLDCTKAPKLGQQVRYNCYAYLSKSEVEK